jgi:hypothetical protein
MKRLLVTLCLLTCRASAQSITDPGFEQPAQAAGGYAYRPAGAAWSFAGGAGLAANDSPFTTGNPAAPQGGQAAFLQGAASFTQSVPDWAAGRYFVSFIAAQRAGGGLQDVQVLIDGAAVGTVTPGGTTYLSYLAGPFGAAAGEHTITFQALNSAGGDNTLLVDSVSVLAATAQLQLSLDIVDLEAKIAAARARVQAEIFELERLHALLAQDAFVASATKPQRDKIQSLLWDIRKFSVP